MIHIITILKKSKNNNKNKIFLCDSNLEWLDVKSIDQNSKWIINKWMNTKINK